MTILLGAGVILALVVASTYIGDPTYRPDRDPGRWQTTITQPEDTP